jgi:hypothetical protein
VYSLYEKYGGENCLQKVDVGMIHELMELVGGADLICFVSHEYDAHAQAVFNHLCLLPVTFSNVWDVFQAMLPYMSSA